MSAVPRASAPSAKPVSLFGVGEQLARLRPRIEQRIARVLEHGRFVLGPEVEALEAALADFCGARHVVTVANGTDALEIALRAEGIGPGDAVFVPAFTFLATAEAPLNLGATPVFVDIDPATLDLDPGHLEAEIERVRRDGWLKPRAIVAVDLFGLPADYPALAKIAERQGLFLLADAAQSFGAAQDERRVGALAPATATSFYPSKPLACYGDGGALFTDDEARASAWRALRHHGSAGGASARVGGNSRLDSIQAAVLLAKLEVFEEELAARAAAARCYDELLPASVTRPARPAGRRSCWALYCIRTPRRDALLAALNAEGIEARVYYRAPLHLEAPYARYGQGAGSLPASEQASAEILALPMHGYLEREDLERVCAVVRSVAG